jgi:NAD(P)-dependent dehydrogenase (short-subunit alcohol dehydrogenase family)
MQPRVLITGAGSGLGRALAERHARRGDRVACVDRDAARAQATCTGLPGERHLAFTADVGDDASMQALADDVRAVWGGLAAAACSCRACWPRAAATSSTPRASPGSRGRRGS